MWFCKRQQDDPRAYVKDHRREIDRFIKQKLGGRGIQTDTERMLWLDRYLKSKTK